MRSAGAMRFSKYDRRDMLELLSGTGAVSTRTLAEPGARAWLGELQLRRPRPVCADAPAVTVLLAHSSAGTVLCLNEICLMAEEVGCAVCPC